MSDGPTRRDVLGVSAAALGGLAGCGVRGTGSRETRSPTAAEREYEHDVGNPESVRVRNPGGEPAVRSSAHTPGEDIFEEEASWAYEDWLVHSASGRSDLEFSASTTGTEEASAFVADTDLSSETVLIHQFAIDACLTRRLERLQWTTGASCGDVQCVDIRLTYDRTHHEAGCERTESETDGGLGPTPREGSRHSEATFVRIPAKIESYGGLSVQW